MEQKYKAIGLTLAVAASVVLIACGEDGDTERYPASPGWGARNYDSRIVQDGSTFNAVPGNEIVSAVVKDYYEMLEVEEAPSLDIDRDAANSMVVISAPSQSLGFTDPRVRGATPLEIAVDQAGCNSYGASLVYNQLEGQIDTTSANCIIDSLYFDETKHEAAPENRTQELKDMEFTSVVTPLEAIRSGMPSDSDHISSLVNFRWNILLVEPSTNELKGDSPVNEWVPSNIQLQCSYVNRYILTKYFFGLSIDPEEKVTLDRYIYDSNCSNLV